MACSGSCGIGAAREEERRHAMAAAALAYPALVWRDVPVASAPFSEDELRDLADAIDEVVAAWQTLVIHGDGAATLRLEGQFGETTGGTAASRLEVVFSALGRFATIREVRAPEGPEGFEAPRLGVDDRRWAPAVKALQGLLRARSITLLDMAFLGESVPGPEQAAYVERFGAEPTWWSLLFRAEPPEARAYRRGPSE
jgi:hypothetical protein